jgi:hypothetical protein
MISVKTVDGHFICLSQRTTRQFSQNKEGITQREFFFVLLKAVKEKKIPRLLFIKASRPHLVTVSELFASREILSKT